MEAHEGLFSSARASEEETDIRRGPWTVDEDLVLIDYIAKHGEGRWNSLARCSGLKRTGKSCRLRWLNYLRPDLRRGNITPEEQLLILELHSRYGNRWSKIAQHLPGRTDNEIKNFWRTRVQKHAKQLQCDVNSEKFKRAMRYLWMPRLLERIHAASSSKHVALHCDPPMPPSASVEQSNISENSVITRSPAELVAENQTTALQQCSIDSYVVHDGENKVSEDMQLVQFDAWWPEYMPSPCGYTDNVLRDLEQANYGEELCQNLWTDEDIFALQ